MGHSVGAVLVSVHKLAQYKIEVVTAGLEAAAADKSEIGLAEVLHLKQVDLQFWNLGLLEWRLLAELPRLGLE
ncbi:hypothetical protein HY441_01770 [Candidatus Microgenomates bacterium]|nr:hypothetical protein [Candidatus Microgenomates bacterium]